MAEELLPYAGSRAARMLDAGIKNYTATNGVGMRALAADLDLRQATSLSHMATGRIGIPLDRAVQLATKLGIDAADFCLAVIEQRTPDAVRALDQAFAVSLLAQAPAPVREATRAIAECRQLTPERLELVRQLLNSDRPGERWLYPAESSIGRTLREHFPAGAPSFEAEPMADVLRTYLDLANGAGSSGSPDE